MPSKKSSGTKSAPPEPACDAPETPPSSPATTSRKAPAGTPRGARAGTARSAPASAPRAADWFLGHAQAVVIVCKCANTIPANLARTLNELGVNGIPFQQAVRTAVMAAGFAIGADDIPGAPGTRLVQVVTIVQNARRSA